MTAEGRLTLEDAARFARLAEQDPEHARTLAEWEYLRSLEALEEPASMAELCDPHFARRPHVEVMSRHLAQLARGGSQRLLIMVPPQTGKSTLAAVWTPMWWLANNPASRIVIGSYNSDLATEKGRAIRKAVETIGWRWGLELEFGSKRVNQWLLTKGGGVKSVGIGSGITGFPANCAVVDDPHKSREESDSRVARERVWNWWSGDLLSRLSPGAPVCLIMTPWHEDDLAHRVLEQDGTVEEGGMWTVIRMPAFATRPDDPLGRAVGDPLTHPLLDPADTQAAHAHWSGRRSQSTVRDWASLYQLDPQPAEGALVSPELVRARTHAPPPVEPAKAAVAVDPSGGGRDTAGIIGGFLGGDGRLYVTDDATLTGPSEKWGRAACQLAVDIDADVIVLEHNYGGDMARVVVRSAWDALARENPDDERYRRLPPQIRLKHAKKGKLLRAEPVAQQIAEDRMRFGAHLPELAWEWQTWQPTDSDSPGRIDASVYLAYELLPVPGSEALVSTPAGVSRSAVSGRSAGRRIERRW